MPLSKSSLVNNGDVAWIKTILSKSYLLANSNIANSVEAVSEVKQKHLLKAIEYYLKGNKSMRGVAKELGIPSHTPLKEWIKKYEKEDYRIKYIFKKNSGVSETRNLGSMMRNPPIIKNDVTIWVAYWINAIMSPVKIPLFIASYAPK